MAKKAGLKRRLAEKSPEFRDRPKLHDHLAAGNGSWFFLLWSIALIANSVLNFFSGDYFLGHFWTGTILFIFAIVFCPCYAGRTCKVIGIHSDKKMN